jgi:hypothetical protein
MNVSELLKLVQGLVRPLVTLGLTATLVALAFLDHPVKEPLSTLTVAAISFWFGAREGAKSTERSDPPA